MLKQEKVLYTMREPDFKDKFRLFTKVGLDSFVGGGVLWGILSGIISLPSDETVLVGVQKLP